MQLMRKNDHNLYLSGSAPVDFSKNPLGEFNHPLLRAFEGKGFHVVNFQDAPIHVYVNHKSVEPWRKSKGSRIFRVLIRTEPISVFPAQYQHRIEKKYDLVITTGMPESKHGKFINLTYPYTTLRNPNFPMQSNYGKLSGDTMTQLKLHDLEQWRNRKIFISLIAANKVSSQIESNYALRRKFAKESEINDLMIYGGLWNDSLKVKLHHRIGVGLHALRNGTIPNLKSLYSELFRHFKNYMGAPEDKQIIMRDSKFALVIENSNTFVSEKLFDALVGGAIPIYFGPELANYGITEDYLVIRHKGNLFELKSRLEKMSDSEILKRIKTIQEFIQSPSFITEWSSDKVFSKIATEISEYQLHP